VDAYREAACTQVVLDFRSQPCDLVTRLTERAAELLSLESSTPVDHAVSAR
jgi:hypothetical protein